MAQAHTPRSPAATISSLASGPEDLKRQVSSYLPHDSKILAMAPARIYHSAFNARPDAWTFTGLRGMLVFGRNRTSIYPDRPLGVGEGTSFEQNYWFRLVDLDSGKGIVWFHQIPPNLDYHADKPFFHVFSGCSRMFGFRFDEDADAEHFLNRVTSRIQITAPRTPKSKTSLSKASSLSMPTGTTTPTPRRVSPSMISSPAPGTFMHVAHMGIDSDGCIDASPNVEPGWTMILEELQGYGVSEKMVSHDLDFVEGFLAGAKAKLVQELQSTPTPIARTPTTGGKKARFMPRRKASGA
ncbi:hypothetical protein PYCCODRAFT_684034 [Trametes coccinea BRFM310]|uniref:WH1-domain-containing protein n=1 Tax=Trametes coccinea (strain BRFM310) TaxID=1353009 RepID=A0A1Y2IKM7_TRAC3|nr:hypothetical protein PYCCODRAFT_684034 [Trametes coccinea BRFM310]